MSGDIELNPGPVQNDNSKAVTSPYNRLLESRLSQLSLRPLDVGGAGDFFFRAVSHQLYGDPNYHFYIRAAGIDQKTDLHFMSPDDLTDLILELESIKVTYDIIKKILLDIAPKP